MTLGKEESELAGHHSSGGHRGECWETVSLTFWPQVIMNKGNNSRRV